MILKIVDTIAHTYAITNINKGEFTFDCFMLKNSTEGHSVKKIDECLIGE